MRVLETRLDGPVLLEPEVHHDERGFFQETFREDRWAGVGVEVPFVQDNHSRSARGVLRGIHFQVGEGQAKLVRCSSGAIFDVVVDLRRGSPTWAQWEGHRIDEESGRQLFCPVGFGHAFCVLSDRADVTYKCSRYYDPALERAIAYDDPEIGIEWPDEHELIVSERDRSAPRLAAVADELPFEYPG